eukprot:TRINITY_DN26412_c0_g2_i1.p1 TRINITY_DN26412_c0_g2~~TRINITY_DN26412_c0_g2_i1.p1  ORF type:complete len:473 (-),score=50.64 TRINITY_DN26412_c0_g2_i1:113-1531(-)
MSLAMYNSEDTVEPYDPWAQENEDEEDDAESDASSLAYFMDRTEDQLKHRMIQFQGRKRPEIPEVPAWPEPPPHTARIPTHFLQPKVVNNALVRAINSTMGRSCVFAMTLALFIFISQGIVDYQDPVEQLNGEHWPLMLASFFALAVMYTCIPMLSEQAGMHPRATGWKPYMALYRCAFLTAIPSITCMALGYGAAKSFGERDGEVGKRLIQDLERESSKYFEAADGFVALNLTKGVTMTLNRMEHGARDTRRISRYRDAELLINREPYTGLSEPTIPPGQISIMVVAPVFSQWQSCASRYQISANCLMKSPPLGWAITTTNSVCNTLNMVSCRPAEPRLDPVYKCSTEAIRGQKETAPVTGLCGRVILPPQSEIIDEIGAILLQDGWPKASLPNASQVWMDVSPDECINDPEECIQRWNLIGTFGVVFAVFTGILIVIPAFIDIQVDENIRAARRFYEAAKNRNMHSMVAV